MSKKIIFSEEQEKEIINLYKNEHLGMAKIGQQYNCCKEVIKKVLMKNNIEIRPSTQKMISVTPGEKYGLLTVSERDYKTQKEKQSTKSYWICKCDCGNIISVCGNNLKTGNNISCGCKKYFNTNHIGEKFGRLLVLNKRFDEQGNLVYDCKCDCGNRKTILSKYIHTTKSCGCLQKEMASKSNYLDLTNQKFGKLTALYSIKDIRTSNGNFLWRCRCECGNEKDIPTSCLTSGTVKSCGCLKSSIGEYIINNILTSNRINFETEKMFEECRFPNSNKKARFDFYLPDYNIIIEYDGIQHFSYKEDNNSSNWNNKENYYKVKERDNFKNKWCKENNYQLIRIPYWEQDNITLEHLLGKRSFNETK